LNEKKQSSPPDPLEARKRITFEQAEGAEALPAQLKPKEISPRLRALLWEAIYLSLERSHISVHRGSEFLEPWANIFYVLHVDREHGMVDEFQNDFHRLAQKTKTTIATGNYVQVFGWIQYVLRHGAPGDFAERIQDALTGARAAYRVVDGDTIAPFGSEAEAQTIERAFADLATTEFHGARRHLRNAAEALTAGKSADSIRESIHAVESVVRVLEPKGDFSKALENLDAKAKIHTALRRGFTSIYGFTSDEKGIRHPLLDDPASKADETDALFMIGACAAFVSYLINKARVAGLL
jgi:hypothetical protein